jgi:DNA-binding MarR family transcriptional regulator
MRKLPNGEAAKAVLAALYDHGILTIAELERATDLLPDTLRANTKRLVDAGEIHIVAYTAPAQSKPPSAIYKLGPGVNATKPPKAKRKRVLKITKAQEAECWTRTPGLQMAYPIKSSFAGGKNPWCVA